MTAALPYCPKRKCACPAAGKCARFRYGKLTTDSIQEVLLALQARLDLEDYLEAGQAYLPLDSGYYDA